MSPRIHSKPQIGVIGLGLLGSAIAERLLDADISILVYDLVRQKAQHLLERGASWSDNPFVECERVIFCLYETSDVEQVLDRFEAAICAGQIFIDATTGSPDETRRVGRALAALGVDYLESPFVASSDQTRRGEGIALVAGPAEAFEACRDLFSAMVANSYFVGTWGDAARVKLVNNLILGLNRAALAEGLWFAETIGLDPAATLEVLRQCNSYSGVMDTKGMKMVKGEFCTQAKLSQHAKDVRIMLDQASSCDVQLPFSQLHLRLLEQAEVSGLGELDNSAIIKAIADASQNNSARGLDRSEQHSS